MLHYRIHVQDANAHIFKVVLEIPVTKPNQTLSLRLPAWIPGSYMIRDFAKNISALQAEQNGTALPIRHCDKQTWQVTPAETAMLVISYEVYAFDLSVRSAYLDQQWAFFNHSSLCMAVDGRTDEMCQVSIEAHAGWHVATGMPRELGKHFGPGEFRVANYEALI